MTLTVVLALKVLLLALVANAAPILGKRLLGERWSLPLAVATAVPFGVLGAVLAIMWAGFPNDIYFQVGLLVLIGLALYHPGWTWKLLVLIYFVMLSNPVSSHALARAAHAIGIPMAKQTVADALFDATRLWLAERNIENMRGPVSPSMNYECGLLIEGFDCLCLFPGLGDILLGQ